MGHHIIFDRDERKLAHLDPKLAHHVEIEDLDGEHTLWAQYPTTGEDAEFIQEGNFISVEDADHNWQLFEIATVETRSSPNGEVKIIHGEHIYYEISTYPVATRNFASVTADFALNVILDGTRWQPGIVEVTGERSVFMFEQNPLEMLRRMPGVWGGELRFRIDITGSGQITRHVDLLTRRGSFTGHRFEFGTNISDLEMQVDMRPLITALVGRGQGTNADQTTGEIERVTFEDIAWSIPGGDPANKPLGQDWVGDEEARIRYGKPAGMGHALEFTGNPDAVNCGNHVAHQFTGSFTLEATIVPKALGNMSIVRKGITGAGTMFLAVDSVGGILHLFVGFVTAAGTTVQFQGPPLILGERHHVAAVLENGVRMRAYVNDVEAIFTTSSTRPANTANVTFIGKRGDDTRFFVGTIDDVRIWNVARTRAEILVHQDREMTGFEPGLVGYYKLNEGSGTAVADSSPSGAHGTRTGTTWVSGLVPVRQHIFGMYDSQAETPEALLEATWLVLQRRNEPRVNVQARVADLEHALPGFHHESLRLGDTVYLIARRFSPPIQATARVIRIERDMHDKTKTRIELGNFRPTTSEDLLIELEASKRLLEARIAITERSEFFEFVGDPQFEYKLDLDDRRIRIFGSTFFYFDGSGLFAINPLDLNHYWRFDNTGLKLTRDGGLTFVHDFGLDHVFIGTDATFAGTLQAASGTFTGSLQAVDGTFLELSTGETGVVHTNFAEYPSNQTPHDFQILATTGNQTLTVVDADNVSGLKVLRHTSTQNANRMFLWNKIPSQENILVSHRFRLSTTTGYQVGIWARIKSTSPITSYVVWITDGNAIRLEKYVGGVATQIAVNFQTFSANVWYWLEMEVVGNIIRARIWSDGITKPTAWTVQTTDNDITGTGLAAIASFQATGTREFDVLSLGAVGARSTIGFATNAAGVSRPFIEMFDSDNRMRFNLLHNRLQFWFGGSGPVGEIFATQIDAGDVFFGNAMTFRAVGSHIFFQIESPAIFPEPIMPQVFKTGFGGVTFQGEQFIFGSMQFGHEALRTRFTFRYQIDLDRVHLFGTTSHTTGLGYGFVFINSSSGFWFGQRVNIDSPLICHYDIIAPNRQKLRRFDNAGQAITRSGSVFQQLTFGTEAYFVQGVTTGFSRTSTTFTIPPGTWLIMVGVSLTTTFNGQYLILSIFSGSDETRRLDAKHATQDGNIHLNGSTIINNTISVTLNIRVLASGSGTTNTVAGSTRTWYEVIRMG